MAELDTLEARKKILKFLEDNDYTQVALAAMIGIPKQQLSKYLSGEDSGTGAYNTLLKILSRFGIK